MWEQVLESYNGFKVTGREVYSQELGAERRHLAVARRETRQPRK